MKDAWNTGKIPGGWRKREMVPIYKKAFMECGSYRGIKLMEHTMKVLGLERVVCKRKIVDIDGMQFGFMKGIVDCEADPRENVIT